MSPAIIEVRAADLFDGLKPEQKQPEDREFKVEKNSRLERIINRYEEVLKVDLSTNRKREEFEPTIEKINAGLNPTVEEKPKPECSISLIFIFLLSIFKASLVFFLDFRSL